jgi:hypothetical protein
MALGRPWCGRTCDKCDNGPAEANGWCSSCKIAFWAFVAGMLTMLGMGYIK